MPVEVLMPALSPTMTKGNLVRWLKQEGETVDAGDVLAEIETDKATMEVESVDEGILSKILVKEGTKDVPVNKLIALILEEGESIEEKESLDMDADVPDSQIKNIKGSIPATDDNISIDKYEHVKDNIDYISSSKVGSNDKTRILITPVAKRLALINKVNIDSLVGSGPNGRILKIDVQTVCDKIKLKDNDVKKSMDDSQLDLKELAKPIKLEISSIRKVIAERLSESKKNIPHFYLTVDCNLDNLIKARKEINLLLKKDDLKISVNDFIIRSAALSLHKVPESNVSWQGDHILQYNSSDISVAVSIEGGLITPVIFNAEKKGLVDISKEMKDLAHRARLGKLSPVEFQGGSFSISNLGMYGIKQFNAIINPPQACILSVGSGEKRAVISENGDIISSTVMTCTLSVDHRAVDGVVGANFLKVFKSLVENPVLMLL
jgi:pyruvate dehydrogenase E2 component (dihydrolipoamide acetyltransferase)